MIEAPRIALNAAEPAVHADFLSIGSNDLTQFTLAVSRDDAEVGFLGSYLRDQVIAADPFEHLDREGVGRILRICIDEARGRRPDLPIGLCGEHAEDYVQYVRAKLEEELEEYLSSGDVDQDELLALARDKRAQRGGFDSWLVWMGNLPGNHESSTAS